MSLERYLEEDDELRQWARERVRIFYQCVAEGHPLGDRACPCGWRVRRR